MLDLSIFGKRTVRLIRQTQETECGLACLAMVSNYLGGRTDLAGLRQSLNPSLRGLKIKSLLLQGEKIGLKGRVVEASIDQLGMLRMPAILHWDMKHFVVLEAVKRGRFVIHDPAIGTRTFTKDGISKHFTGVAAEFQASSGQTSPTKRQPAIRPWRLIQSVKGLWPAIAQAVLLSFLLQAYILASPFYLQVAVDTVLPSLDVDLLATLAIGFSLFALVQASATLMRSMILLRIGSVLGWTLTAETGHKLLRLPISWFEKRHTGDILSRFQSINPINQTLTEGSVIMVIDGVLAITTLVLMFFYSTWLSFISLSFVIIFFVSKFIFLYFERRATEDSIVDSAFEQTEMIENVEGIQTLRVFGAEFHKHSSWINKLADSFNSNIRLQRIKNFQEAVHALLFPLENIIIIYFAVQAMLDADGFSLGMLFAYTAYKASFINSTARLIDQFMAIKMLGLHADRLGDITTSSEDACFSDDCPGSDIFGEKIELKNLYFRYSEYDPYIFAGANLTVDKGEHIAITGPSGGGKTTIVKLLLGLLTPTDGEILIDGQSQRQFGIRNLQDLCGVVLQDGGFFHGSIAQSIALFDDEMDMSRVKEAARCAGFHDEIVRMPLKYHSPVGKFGSALSGGQRQRLLIARAIYRQPAILIMDEATSHLDYDIERQIVDSIKQLKTTRITIAHRLDTIIAADKVFKVQAGRISQVDKEQLLGTYLEKYT